MKNIIFSVCIMGIFLSCFSNQIYSDSDYKKGKILTLSAGETVEFRFDSQPSTGYSWQPSFSEEKFTLISDSIISKKSNKAKTGQVETQSIKIKALSLGESEIEFNYVRAWENEKPERTMKVVVNVK